MSGPEYPPPSYPGSAGEASAWVRAGRHPARADACGGGGAAHYLATGATTGGAFGLYRWDMGPEPSGPCRTSTAASPSRSSCSAARCGCTTGGSWIDAGPGDFLHVPIGGVHGFRNESGEPASMLLLFTPGAPREDYFETLADAARRDAMGDDDWAEFFLRHDTFWVVGS